jgi:hypothetical protein
MRPTIIETTDNRLFQVVRPFEAHALEAIPVKRVRGGFAPTAKARATIINRAHVLGVVEGAL